MSCNVQDVLDAFLQIRFFIVFNLNLETLYNSLNLADGLDIAHCTWHNIRQWVENVAESGEA